uniref:Multidrug and toxic compound extrusion protein n=1 Tax=Chenopodium quinoa TaxID=63459 RepID=A0A803MCJ5_CHEQI
MVLDQAIPLMSENNDSTSNEGVTQNYDYFYDDLALSKRVWIESKKLWHIVGPTIVTRIAAYTLFVIAQSFAGHIGDAELAAISLGSNVIVGLTCGLLVGMASALETLCGQAYGAKKYYMLAIGSTGPCCGSSRDSDLVSNTIAPMFPVPLPATDVPSKPAAARDHGMGFAIALCLAWWIQALVLFGYIVFWGGCPLCWAGFSMEAFSGLWEFIKLSTASGVMICLEYWYSTALVLMTGNLKNADIALDALSICTSINQWEIMIPFAFFAGVGVRVANELGAGNGKGARFATIVASTTSIAIGVVFWLLAMIFHDKLALIFSNSQPVLEEVDKLSVLLAFTILLNSLQPVLSGIPLGLLLGWTLHGGVTGIWGGMIVGTAVQTMILGIITMRCNWEKEANKASRHVDKWEAI